MRNNKIIKTKKYFKSFELINFFNNITFFILSKLHFLRIKILYILRICDYFSKMINM